MSTKCTYRDPLKRIESYVTDRLVGHLSMPQPIDPFSTFKPRPERKRGRGARFGRGGGYFPSHLRSDREQQRQQQGFDATVKEILRDEQITSDATIFNVNAHIAHLTEDPYFALLDTGASIPVIPPQVAADLNLTLTELETPTRVRMANGAIEYIHQVADLGPIIGFVSSNRLRRHLSVWAL